MKELQSEMEEIKKQMASVCASKAEEFRMLGYENVTATEIWDCISSYYKQEIPGIHRVVNDIISLKASKFMHWLTMKIYRGEFD